LELLQFGGGAEVFVTIQNVISFLFSAKVILIVYLASPCINSKESFMWNSHGLWL